MGVNAIDARNDGYGKAFFTFFNEGGVLVYIVALYFVVIVVKLIEVDTFVAGLLEYIFVFKGDFLFENRL